MVWRRTSPSYEASMKTAAATGAGSQYSETLAMRETPPASVVVAERRWQSVLTVVTLASRSIA